MRNFSKTTADHCGPRCLSCFPPGINGQIGDFSAPYMVALSAVMSSGNQQTPDSASIGKRRFKEVVMAQRFFTPTEEKGKKGGRLR